MLDRDKFLAQVNDPRDKEVVARGLDLAEGVLRFYKPQLSDFYDPFHTALLISVLKMIPGIAVASDGGYAGAERKRLIVCPDYLDPLDEDPGLAFLAIEGNFNFSRASHRDFLGSLLGLGLRREKIGDIIVDDSQARLVVAREVTDFIRMNLSRVGRARVKVREITREGLSPPPPKFKEIRSTVPSLRLDVVAASAFNISRSKMAREVNVQRVALNWRLCTNQSAPVKEGDVISVRGRGRAEVAEVMGRTKKGRIAVLLKRYV